MSKETVFIVKDTNQNEIGRFNEYCDAVRYISLSLREKLGLGKVVSYRDVLDKNWSDDENKYHFNLVDENNESISIQYRRLTGLESIKFTLSVSEESPVVYHMPDYLAYDMVEAYTWTYNGALEPEHMSWLKYELTGFASYYFMNLEKQKGGVQKLITKKAHEYILNSKKQELAMALERLEDCKKDLDYLLHR